MQRSLTHKNSGTVRRIFQTRSSNLLRSLICVALSLSLLDHQDQRIETVAFLRDVDAAAVQFGDEVGFAALVRNHRLATVADQFRRTCSSVASSLTRAEASMPALVAKADWLDVGRLRFPCSVQQSSNARDSRRLAADSHSSRNASLEFFSESRFQEQRRDDGGRIGVATALADAVQRALDRRTRPTPRRRIATACRCRSARRCRDFRRDA